VLRGALFSDDSRVFVDSLQRLGVDVEADSAASDIVVQGTGGSIPSNSAALYIGNAGTAARFLTALLPLGHGEYVLDGTPRMRQRPIGELLEALNTLGADATSVHGNGCPPVAVHASGLRGGAVTVDATRSGQFLSALLLVAPYSRSDTTLSLAGHLASPPYVDMTIAMMGEWGVTVDADGDPIRSSVDRPVRYMIRAGDRYQPRIYDIPPDASGASYFLAAAAVTSGSVRVRNLALATDQGDLGLLHVLERMGCKVVVDGPDVELSGPAQLDGIDLDLNAMSDMTMTLAAIAPFAREPVVIRNVGHIREQETDRLAATVAELRRLGARVDELPDGLKIYPSALHPALVHTYDDHRMAMAFSIPGLVVSGIEIENPGCVAKTFPDYFACLELASGRS
jgi:3-phosphoshikimate 1-carboxyvinyltransferase